MPDRIVRARILKSDMVNTLGWPAEVFYRRLMSIVDDFGRYEARPSVLRADLYPLKLDKVSESDVVKWLGECSKAGLVRCYTVEKKGYLEVLQFNQRLRAFQSKYPAPLTVDSNGGQMSANAGHPPPEVEGEEEVEKKRERGAPAGAKHSPEDVDMFNAFKGWIDKHAPRVNQMKQPITIDQYMKLRKKFSGEIIQKLLMAMQNRGDLQKKYVSAYLTITNWAQREKVNQPPNSTTSDVNERLKAAGKPAEQHH